MSKRGSKEAKPDEAAVPEAEPVEVDALEPEVETSDQEAADEQTPEQDAPDQDALEQMAADVAAAVDAEQAAEQAAEAEPVDPIEALAAKVDQANDLALRHQAELENYRKRAAREMQEHRRYANLPLMRDLLPVLDNIDRAVEAAEKTHDTASLLDGVKIVARQFADVLKRYDCVLIDALEAEFDPHLHEAISQQPSDDYPPGTVVLVAQTGYQLHDRVVRPSQVIVSTPAASETDE